MPQRGDFGGPWAPVGRGRKLRPRQLTQDGNVEITGRDLRERADARPENRDRSSPAAGEAPAMLTRDIGFGRERPDPGWAAFGLTLRRVGRAGLPLCIGVMGVGTAMVLAGLYANGWSVK